MEISFGELNRLPCRVRTFIRINKCWVNHYDINKKMVPEHVRDVSVQWMSIVLHSSTEVNLEAFGLKQQSSQSTMFDINTPVHVWCHKTFRWMKWICSEPEAQCSIAVWFTWHVFFSLFIWSGGALVASWTWFTMSFRYQHNKCILHNLVANGMQSCESFCTWLSKWRKKLQ